MQFERLRKAEISQAAELAARSFLDYAYFSIFVPDGNLFAPEVKSLCPTQSAGFAS